MPPKDITRWVRAGAIGFAVLALAATAANMSQKRARPAGASAPAATHDPLAAELERCNALSPTSGRDEACERAWAENRRRFLGVPSRAAAPAASPSAPSTYPESRP